ncbi:MAG: hypothetical protein LBF81_01630, partial [Prevotellaceae bacterium]|nr:hypothetical protein [Prevotellaceae bacterium]
MCFKDFKKNRRQIFLPTVLFCIQFLGEGGLVPRKRSYTRTTDSYHHFHRYKNILKDMQVISPNQAWVSDITYIRLR